MAKEQFSRTKACATLSAKLYWVTISLGFDYRCPPALAFAE